MSTPIQNPTPAAHTLTLDKDYLVYEFGDAQHDEIVNAAGSMLYNTAARLEYSSPEERAEALKVALHNANTLTWGDPLVYDYLATLKGTCKLASLMTRKKVSPEKFNKLISESDPKDSFLYKEAIWTLFMSMNGYTLEEEDSDKEGQPDAKTKSDGQQGSSTGN